jgi:hypothetical protein
MKVETTPGLADLVYEKKATVFHVLYAVEFHSLTSFESFQERPHLQEWVEDHARGLAAWWVP